MSDYNINKYFIYDLNFGFTFACRKLNTENIVIVSLTQKIEKYL